MEIQNRIIKTELVRWRDIKWFQNKELKKLDAADMLKLKRSLVNNNFIMPFHVWKNKNELYFLDGHHREKAMRELEESGFDGQQIKIPDLLPANFVRAATRGEAAKLVLIYSSIYAKITEDGLAEYFNQNKLDISSINDEINIPDLKLDRLILDDIPEEKFDEVPEKPAEALSKLGDLFVLNKKHRVLCGDATEKGHVRELCGPQRADMVFTDPPYNVNYEGYTKDKLKIKSDALAGDKYIEFLNLTFENYREMVKDECAFYICHASAWQRQVEEALNRNNIEVRNQIIWAKNTFAWGMGRYKFQHEPIFYAHINNKSDHWYGDKNASTLWEVDKPSKNKEHPTMKPIELINIALNNSSKIKNMILDLFLGSGSTIIACERMNRICYGLELDPIYVDVILKRFHNLYPDKEITCSNRKFNFAKLWNAK